MKKLGFLTVILSGLVLSGCANVGLHGKCECKCPSTQKKVEKTKNQTNNSQTLIQFKKSPFDDEENIQNILNGDM